MLRSLACALWRNFTAPIGAAFKMTTSFGTLVCAVVAFPPATGGGDFAGEADTAGEGGGVAGLVSVPLAGVTFFIAPAPDSGAIFSVPGI